MRTFRVTSDEKRSRCDSIVRLQAEQSKLQDKLYDDRLDGFIEPDFFERKAREWRQTEKRLADPIAEFENPRFIICLMAFAY